MRPKYAYLSLAGTGILLGVLAVLLQWGHYRWLVFQHSFELYALLVALVFTFTGIWLGNQLMKPKIITVEKTVRVEVEKPVSSITFNKETFIQATGLSDRELEVLQLMVSGNSNQEIANALFVSLSTVKTHVSNIFIKLEVSRRTQAVQKAREWGL